MRRTLGLNILAALAALSANRAEADDAPAPAPAPKITIVRAAPEPEATPAPAPAAKPAAAPEVAAPHLSKQILAIVNAKDRTDDDRALDAGRKPGEMLAFFDIKPGMKVAEIGAGAGYTTELLARAVGPKGKVYAQNPPAFLNSFLKTSWPERLARPVNANVVREDREFDSPFTDDVQDLDAIVIVALYHDIVWLGADRKAMNEALFKAVKPGGALFVIDSSAKEDSGVNDAKTLHRIDEAVVLEEMEEAGFRFDRESGFLRNPNDARDWNSSPKAAAERRGTSDRFALKFLKPRHHPKKTENSEKPEAPEKAAAAPAKSDDAKK